MEYTELRQSQGQAADMLIEPLTRCNNQGIPYKRDDAIERQILETLTLLPEQLRERMAILNQEAPGYLREECLVYLLRHYLRSDDQYLVNDLTNALLHRCVNLIHSHMRSLDPEAAHDAEQDVIERLFAPILDLKNDRGDFLQVRFWVVLKRLAIEVYQDHLTASIREQQNVPLSSLAGYDHDETDEDARHPRSNKIEVASPSAELVVIQDDQIRDALSHVDEPYRSAFLLRNYLSWPIEDQDTSVQTISRHFGKDPRTIRNWLRKADEMLRSWRGEEQ